MTSSEGIVLAVVLTRVVPRLKGVEFIGGVGRGDHRAPEPSHAQRVCKRCRVHHDASPRTSCEDN